MPSSSRAPQRVAVLLALIGACAKQPSQPSQSAAQEPCPPLALPTAAQRLGIIGGMETAAYPEVLQLRITAASGAAATCTGTFHTASVMITAAHCLHAIANGGPLSTVSLEATGEKAVDWFYNPGYLPTDSSTSFTAVTGMPYHRAAINRYQFKSDLAAVRFLPSASHMVAPISRAPRSVGQVVRMVGWGVTAEDLRASAAGAPISESRKRTAPSKIVDLYDDVIVLQEGGEGLLPRLAQGDSGGNIFDPFSGEALAIVSSGILASEAAYRQAVANPLLSQVGPRLGVAVDLASASAQAFYMQIQQRWGIVIPDNPSFAGGAARQMGVQGVSDGTARSSLCN